MNVQKVLNSISNQRNAKLINFHFILIWLAEKKKSDNPAFW